VESIGQQIRPDILAVLITSHCTEFKSKTKARSIANDTDNTDPVRGLEFDLHQVAGLEVDPAVELHARAA
jgi:hypothetical protein